MKTTRLAGRAILSAGAALAASGSAPPTAGAQAPPGQPVVLVRQWPLPAGVWQVRFLVLDPRTRKVGTAIHTFEVPDPKAFRLSTPLVTDRLEETGGGRKPLLQTLTRTEAFTVSWASGREAPSKTPG